MKQTKMKVGPFTYTVAEDKNLGAFGKAGVMNSDNLMVSIDPSVAVEVQKETLVHETLHAVWKQTPLVVMIPDEDEDSKGELIIQALSPLLFQWIRENPEVIAWLQS